MKTPLLPSITACTALLLAGGVALQAQHEVTARVILESGERHDPETRAELLWLEPLSPAAKQELKWTPQSSFRLLQKNKMFSPHLLVVPVGAVVAFPNADPFFHNVFSLFDGKRFDLGLYETGQSRDVHFEGEGISYIFCNIHPGMAAVVIALTTRLWATSGADGGFRIENVPEGTYEAHLWVEGEDEQKLVRWTHAITVQGTGPSNAGSFRARALQASPHLDKFGHSYKLDPAPY